MARSLPSIPNTSGDIPKVIADILNPMRSILERRFLGRGTNDTAVTRQDLIKLGLATQDQINNLDN